MKKILCTTGLPAPGSDSPAMVSVRYLPGPRVDAPTPGLRDLAELVRHKAATFNSCRKKIKT